MSEFSQELERGIYKSRLTESQLAKISGFPRSYIALMKNGQRVSPDTEKMKKLLEALSLSPYEYETVWNAYQKARYGNQTYELYKSVIAFIESFGKLPQISIKSDLYHEIPEIRTIHNRVDLEIFLKAVIEQEALQREGKVQMIMQEDFPFLYRLLPSLFRSNGNMRVEHIICLESADGETVENSRHNLQILGTLMPVFLAGSENGYEAYYYYDHISSHFASSVLMPYLVMTSQYVILISVNLEYAVISREPDVRRLYEMLFMQRKNQCRSMLCRMPAGPDLFEYYQKSRQDSDTIYMLGSQPCFGLLPVDAIVQNYWSEEKQGILRILLQIVEDNQKLYAGAKAVTSYFTRSGLRRLMDEGIVEELPGEISTVLAPEDRRRLLQLLIHAIKTGIYEGYLLDEQKIVYPRELQICAYSMMRVNIVYLSQNTEVRFVLKEQSETKTLYDFMIALKDSVYVSSQKETLAFLEAVEVACQEG